MYKNQISIVGAGECSFQIADWAHEIGNYLAENGIRIICGGLSGVMHYACKGAYEAGGETMGILPGPETSAANQYVTHPIATDLGQMRNYLVVLNGLFTIAISGGYGTLSEVAMACKLGKKVIALGEWDNLPGVEPAKGPEDVFKLVHSLLPNRT